MRTTEAATVIIIMTGSLCPSPPETESGFGLKYMENIIFYALLSSTRLGHEIVHTLGKLSNRSPEKSNNLAETKQNPEKNPLL